MNEFDDSWISILRDKALRTAQIKPGFKPHLRSILRLCSTEEHIQQAFDGLYKHQRRWFY